MEEARRYAYQKNFASKVKKFIFTGKVQKLFYRKNLSHGTRFFFLKRCPHLILCNEESNWPQRKGTYSNDLIIYA